MGAGPCAAASGPLRLSATVAASPFDAYYEAAFVFCHDSAENYSFALSRAPDQDEIELRVREHLTTRVNDLDLRWDGRRLTAWLPPHVAQRLDGRATYEIALTLADDAQPAAIEAALRKIFEGKRGLQLLV
jgi:hypothetical protein